MGPVSGLSPLRNLASLLGQGLLDTLFPLECVGCGRSGKVICDICAADLPVLKPPYCEICGVPGDFHRCQTCAESVRPFDGIRAPYRYAGVIRQAILALKYGGIRAGSTQLGDLLGAYLVENPLRADVLMAVPMHSQRQRERGYNQADLLARRVARACGMEYHETALVRTVQSDPQASLSNAAERAINVAGSVSLDRNVDVSGAMVIVVDDVATTGSTLGACAVALKNAGAASVWGLTLAIAGRDTLPE